MNLYLCISLKITVKKQRLKKGYFSSVASYLVCTIQYMKVHYAVAFFCSTLHTYTSRPGSSASTGGSLRCSHGPRDSGCGGSTTPPRQGGCGQHKLSWWKNSIINYFKQIKLILFHFVYGIAILIPSHHACLFYTIKPIHYSLSLYFIAKTIIVFACSKR